VRAGIFFFLCYETKTNGAIKVKNSIEINIYEKIDLHANTSGVIRDLKQIKEFIQERRFCTQQIMRLQAISGALKRLKNSSFMHTVSTRY
jgi:hypothetical protein